MSKEKKRTYFKNNFSAAFPKGQPNKISFDCGKANNLVDMFICSKSNFSNDQWITATYSELMENLGDKEKKKLKKQQVQWIKQKNIVCENKGEFDSLNYCINNFHSKRWMELIGLKKHHQIK